MQNFPARLKSARLKRGYSMQELVDRLKGQISVQAISRYENGVMKPTNKTLLLLCKVLEVRPDYFERITTVELGEAFYRKLSSLPIKEINSIREYVIDYLERFGEIEEILDDFVKTDLSMKFYSVKQVEDVEKVAEEVREKLKIHDSPIAKVIELLEEKGLKIVGVSPNTKGFDGFATLMNDQYPIIVYNKDNPIDRIRFTVLHELAHLILDLPEDLTHRQEEMYVNRFASAMLIPQNKMFEKFGYSQRSNIHLKELAIVKQEYGISMAALLYRAKDLGIISKFTFQEQIKLFKRLKIWKQEPEKLQYKEEPNRFLQLLCRGLAEEIISTSKAAYLYDMKLGAFLNLITQIDTH